MGKRSFCTAFGIVLLVTCAVIAAGELMVTEFSLDKEAVRTDEEVTASIAIEVAPGWWWTSTGYNFTNRDTGEVGSFCLSAPFLKGSQEFDRSFYFRSEASQGLHEVSFTVFQYEDCNESGAVSNALSDRIILDDIPPRTSISTDVEPNERGWYSTNVSVDTSCDDTVPGITDSGVDSETSVLPNRTVTDEGETTIAATCVDHAGNSTEQTEIVRIDKTLPEIEISGVEDGETFQVGAPVSVNLLLVEERVHAQEIAGFLDHDGEPVTALAQGENEVLLDTRIVGPFQAIVVIEDVAGNVQSASRKIEIVATEVD